MANNKKEGWNDHLFVPFADLPALEQLKDINGLVGNLRARTAGARLAVSPEARVLPVGAESLLGEEVGFPDFSARAMVLSQGTLRSLANPHLRGVGVIPVAVGNVYGLVLVDGMGNVLVGGTRGDSEIALRGGAYTRQEALFQALLAFERNFAPFINDKILVASKLDIASLVRGQSPEDVVRSLELLAAVARAHREKGKGKNFVQFVDVADYLPLLENNNILLSSDAVFPEGTVIREIRNIETDLEKIQPGSGVTFYDRQAGDYFLDIMSTLIVDGMIARLDLTKVAEGDAVITQLESVLRQLTGNPGLKLERRHVQALKDFRPENIPLHREIALKAVKAILADYIRQYKLIIDSTDWAA